MATYIFRCGYCGHVFEVRRPMDIEGPAVCPQCGDSETSKVPTAPGIVFNWHMTDGVKIGSERYRPPAVPASIM